MTNAYKTCPKCSIRYSTLTKHRCFKVEKAPEPEFNPEEDELKSKHKDDDAEQKQGDGNGQGDGEGQGEGGGEGEGQGKGEGTGQGEGEEGEDGEGEAEQEAPKPEKPDPKESPVAIVCSVLKFAALTAACAKNGIIEVTVVEDGLSVYGHSGDAFAHHIMPWGEFEQRSTIDGQFYVKEVIDDIDGQLDEAPEPEAKPKAKKAKAPKLTLPLTVGQRVVCRNGNIARVICEGDEDRKNRVTGTTDATVETDHGTYFAATGLWWAEEDNADSGNHIVADAK